MIRFNNKDIFDIESALKNANLVLTFDAESGVISCSDPVAAQAIIDALPDPMPDLLPVQFNFLLAKYGFDDAIDSLLIALKDEDIDKYACINHI